MCIRDSQHTTVEQIYQKVGISRSFFYSFFPTKEDLVVEEMCIRDSDEGGVGARRGQRGDACAYAIIAQHRIAADGHPAFCICVAHAHVAKDEHIVVIGKTKIDCHGHSSCDGKIGQSPALFHPMPGCFSVCREQGGFPQREIPLVHWVKEPRCLRTGSLQRQRVWTGGSFPAG